MHVNALDAAAALAGIEGRAIHQCINGSVQIRVFHDIARILSAQFQPHAGKGSGSGFLHGTATCDRAGEIDEVERTGGNQLFACCVVEEQVLKHVSRHACFHEGAHHALTNQQCLSRMLDDDRIASHQRRSDRVDCRHVGVVPRRDDEDDAMRLALYAARKGGAPLDLDRRQRLCGHACDIVRALVETLELAAIANGAAHLPCQFRHDLVHHLVQARNALHHQLNAILQRALGPVLLRPARASDRFAGSFQRTGRTFGIDRTIYRRDTLDHCHDRFPVTLQRTTAAPPLP